MRVSDVATIRAVLETDRAWSIYAVGDLAPGFYEHSEWHCAPGPEPALVLLYKAFEIPLLFALGSAASVSGLLDEIAVERALYLSIRPDSLPLIEARYRVESPGGGHPPRRARLGRGRRGQCLHPPRPAGPRPGRPSDQRCHRPPTAPRPAVEHRGP